MSLPDDREPTHGLHTDDGTGEFTASTEGLSREMEWLGAYLHENYSDDFPGRTPQAEINARLADEKRQLRRTPKVTRLAERLAREQHRSYMAHCFPEELCEQT